MGGHFMPSAAAAPLSQSRGPNVNIHPLLFTYPAGGADVAVHVYDSDFAAASGLADYVAAASAEAVAARGAFTIALSGGSLIKSLAGLVGRADVDFSKWWVLFVDERNVPLGSDDSNYKAAHQELLRKVGGWQSGRWGVTLGVIGSVEWGPAGAAMLAARPKIMQLPAVGVVLCLWLLRLNSLVHLRVVPPRRCPCPPARC